MLLSGWIVYYMVLYFVHPTYNPYHTSLGIDGTHSPNIVKRLLVFIFAWIGAVDFDSVLYPFHVTLC